MAIHRVFIHEGQKPPASAIAEAERASRMPINFEDAPEMTEEQLAKAAAIARARRAARRKSNLTIRMTKPKTSSVMAIPACCAASSRRQSIIQNC